MIRLNRLRLSPDAGLAAGIPGILLATALAAAVSRSDSSFALPFNALFWVSLLLTIRGLAGSLRALPLFVPFGILYFFTFLGRRELPERLNFLFDSDTFRHLKDLAPGLYVEARHLGYPVLTFPFNALKEFVGETVASEYLYLETAACGMFGAFLLFVLLRKERVERVRAFLVSSLFACSIAVWTLSSVIDTYAVSVMLLFGFLILLKEYVERPVFRSCVLLALYAAVMLLISLENLYVLILVTSALLYARIRRQRTFRLRSMFLFEAIAITAVMSAMLLSERVMGPELYHTYEDNTATNVVESVTRWGSSFLHLENVWSPVQCGRVLFHVFVMAVTAQTGVSPEFYTLVPGLLSRGENMIYYIVMSTILAMAFTGIRARKEWSSRLMIAILLILIAMRHVFMMVFGPNENVLFSLPSVAAFWVIIGLGLGGMPVVSHRGGRMIDAMLAGAAMFLFFHNLQYLLVLELPL